MSVIDDTKVGANKTIIVQATLTIIAYNCQNIFIVQATEVVSLFSGLYYEHIAIVNDDSRVVSE
jgi:hypothetical protein